ncbi:helix-turn-helix domain-containing protein [Candidatus Entotheonella palauensis]|uniref:Transcriptional regulator n=1 Tax=Candidatus Entotheonella gemina TaxID=1429439 RepID=W4M309_9BACT|nr:hypothetical protein [Candidatus Entotheonella palauensis]ETX04580.1 MAG: hypothetical protein ETSY2_27990 [Candidatus Entotheonella gemina]
MAPGINIAHAQLTYTNLLDYFEPRPIQNDEQYWSTQEVIDTLLSKPVLSEDEEAYLHLLSILLETYDDEQQTIPELRGIELVRTLIQEAGLKQRDLLPIFKHESIVSDVLSGHRKLTVAHIDALATFFELPHRLFFEPS